MEEKGETSFSAFHHPSRAPFYLSDCLGYYSTERSRHKTRGQDERHVSHKQLTRPSNCGIIVTGSAESHLLRGPWIASFAEWITMLSQTLAGCYSALCGAHPGLLKSTRRLMYQLVARHIQAHGWSFMNYGYAPLDGHGEPLSLTGTEERDRYAIQLYAHVVQGIDLTGRDVLEVGSGRGGGVAYLRRCCRLRRIVGVDLTEQAVAICHASQRATGLAFLAADAEHLPFEGGSFDAVVNVESSHCYASMDAFLREVQRVLKPGGAFLFADFRARHGVAELNEQIRRCGMSVVRSTDITPNVLRALDLGTEARIAWIREVVPWYLRGLAREFAGVQASNMYERFRRGAVVYQSYQLRAP